MTSLYLYNPEQGQVLNSSASLVNVSYHDNALAVHTLVLSSLKKVLQGQRSIIVAPSEQDRSAIIDTLEYIGLSDLFFEAKLDEPVHAQEIAQLHKKLTTPLGTKDRYEADVLEFAFRHKNDETITAIESLSKSFFGKLSWKEILHRYIGLVPSDQVFMLHANIDTSDFQCNIEEFEELSYIISEALFLYNKDFEGIGNDQQDFGKGHNESLVDRLQDVTYDLFTFKELAHELRDRYYFCLNDFEQSQRKDTVLWVKDILYRLEYIVFRAQKYVDKTNAAAHSNKFIQLFTATDKGSEQEKLEILQGFNDIVGKIENKKIPIDLHKVTNVEEVIIAATKLNESILSWQKKTAQRIATNIKATNTFNFQDSRLHDLEADLQQLLAKINQSKIFGKAFEINTLSFRKQVDLISNLVHQIELLMTKIENNMPYYQWQQFLSSQDSKAVKVIEALCKLEPEVWMERFEAWYYFEMLTQNYTYQNANASQMDSVVSTYGLWQEAAIQLSIRKTYDTKVEAVKTLKKNNTLWYDIFLKNKAVPAHMTWKDVLEENTAFFSRTFPILIVSSDDLRRLAPGHYECLILHNKPNVDVEILQNFATINTYIPVHVAPPTGIDFTLSSAHLMVDNTLQDATMSDRWSLVKKMASNLLLFGNEPVIYQMRNTTIISYSNDFIHQLLEEELYHFGIKKVLLDGSVQETLVGTLLDTDMRTFIITDDYLFNARSASSYMYQRHVMQLMSDAGCTILHVDHKDMFVSKGKCLHEIIEVLQQVDHTGTSSKNQLSLELNS